MTGIAQNNPPKGWTMRQMTVERLPDYPVHMGWEHELRQDRETVIGRVIELRDMPDRAFWAFIDKSYDFKIWSGSADSVEQAKQKIEELRDEN